MAVVEWLDNGALGPGPVLHLQTISPSNPDVEPHAPSMVHNKALSTPATPETPILEKNLQEYQSAFDDNMQNKPVKHDETFVLLLSWDDELDDLKVKPELDVLKRFLKKSYGFNVNQEQLGRVKEGHQLDQKKLTHQLNRYLSVFLEEYDDQDRLLIIYYGGHGRFQNGAQNQKQGMELHSSSTQTKRFKIAWGDSHSLINTKADVLVVFDCCQAGGFGGTKIRGNEPNFEFIAACGHNQTAAPPGNKSFTTAFIWALGEFKKNPDECPFTSVHLVDKIKARLADVNPEVTQVPELQRCNPTSNGIVWIAPQNNRQKMGKRWADQAERRHAHHEYIDLRFNFFRRVEVQDASNVAKHLSRLVNDHDDFAKHISMITVSNPIIKYANHWKNETTKRKRANTFNSDTIEGQIFTDVAPMSNSTALIKSGFEADGASPTELSRKHKRARRTEYSETSEAANPELQQSQGALFHLQMFAACSFQWMAARVVPRFR